MASNPDSKFSSFSLKLKNDITITGLKYIPRLPSASSDDGQLNRPLIILIHGGTCTAHNFDVSPSLTATTYASQFCIPIISINRPGYLNSTALPIDPQSTYHKTLGHFYHTTLFPALWRTFGVPNTCTALVPLAHSIGSAGIIISSALHAMDTSPAYPLGGIIFSGWGIYPAPNRPLASRTFTPAERLTWKTLIMISDPELNCAPPEARAAVELQDHSMETVESIEFFNGVWDGYWREYSDRVTAPVMFGIGEHDRFYEGSLKHVREYEACFPNAARFDASLVLGAPHAIEWSWYAKGWYLRCFGFAIEVTEALNRRKKDSKVQDTHSKMV